MTDTELTDRLREAIVLDGPDAWRTNGYLEDARQAGLSEADAQKRAVAISQEVANNNLLFQNIQARIARLAQPSRIHLYDQDLNQIVNAASSLKLSPDFVRHQWVPTVLKRLGGESKAQQPQPVVESPVPAPPPIAEPVAKPAVDPFVERTPELPKPAVTPPEPVRSGNPVIEAPVYVSPPPVAPIERPLKPPSPPEPAPVVRSFTATPARVSKGQPVTLAWEVDNLLAVTIDDLGEGLSPTNRGWVKPTKTTDYTLFDANNNPLSTVRVEVIKPDRSGLYGVLFALTLLAVIYWFIKSTNKNDDGSTIDRKAEQTTSASDERPSSRKKKVKREKRQPKTETSETVEPTAEPTTKLPELAKKAEPPVSKPTREEKPVSVEPAPKPATPADARQGKYEEAFGDKPYDKVELGTDERGWRRARSNGRWGYVNANDEWVIQPEFEAVTPFRGNTAAVFLNGQLMTINRSGEQVKK
ncbi:WG repeat-containing protein [Spirosoma radiotolerans]|uniref:KWG repeat-containing protein n=1 Tax=Spirosoma radiotolerans TaxID=1379870 RepID=A0A0E3ZWN3_9BACT|nr:WG repeat-containing protein [Spirosoma radiotolerans]AKD56453.1 KWG repeat-containing protein [Spirosoma radiotolerans]